ncbi:MAG: hypothetical protein HOO67_02295, partial [Candidatus Peribacteraceae bacterium]|nr:hypothetical protein [Candidatus Peribacteraceae bacterium]
MITQKLLKDEQLLDVAFRKKVITEITAGENVTRKNLALRKQEIYKDQVRKWVIEALSKEFSPETVKQMENRAANISVLKKIVNKLAKSYNNGVDRTIPKVLDSADEVLPVVKTIPLDDTAPASPEAQAVGGPAQAPGDAAVPAPKASPSPKAPVAQAPAKTAPIAKADTAQPGVTAPTLDGTDPMTDLLNAEEQLGDGTDSIDPETLAIQEWAKVTKLDSAMKKVDRYTELHRNCTLQVIPEVVTRESEGDAKKYCLKLRVLAPHSYDVIEDVNDNEVPRVYILTDFVERNQLSERFITDSATQDGRSNGITPLFSKGNGKDEIIADGKDDKGTNVRTFIWWNEKFHFTTDKNGEIITALSPSDNLNPIQMLPFVNFALDQDGSFWAEGGDDLVEGAILTNVLITDMLTIANTQGWGQLVLTGKKDSIPKKIVGGPHNAFIFTYDEGDPEPKATYATANAPIEVWMRMIEQYVALLLSTNDLSVSTVSAKLDVATFPSGIAQVIDQSESTGSVEDKQQMYREKEPEVFTVIQAWGNLLREKDSLAEKLDELPELEDTCVHLKFNSAKPVVSEKEKLETLKVRKDLGISTMIDLIKLDNSELTDKEAEFKALELAAEKLNAELQARKRMAEMGLNPQMGPDGKPQHVPPGSAGTNASGENNSGEINT